jgi:hypothetical protein
MRRLAVAVSVAAAALLCYVAARVAVSTPAFEARLRARVIAALAARLDAVEVGEVRVDPLFRVAIAPLRASARGGAVAFSVEKVRVRPALLALLSGRAEPAAIGPSPCTASSQSAVGSAAVPGVRDCVARVSKNSRTKSSRIRAPASWTAW